MKAAIKVLGFTESHTTCDRCGKSELKGTYVISANNSILYLGSSCVSHKFEMSASELKDSVTAIHAEMKLKINAINKEMDAALVGVDFWEQYDEFVIIENAFKNKIESIKLSYAI